ncbi:MAG: acyl-CoA dehydrogenase family protein [Sphingobium sp.]
MDLTPNDDQIAFQTATADWCRDHMPLEGARARPSGLWSDVETMGWTGMTGTDMGLDHATEALVFAELGRFLAPVALLSTAVAARWTNIAGKVALALPSAGGVRVFDGGGALHALGLFDERIGYFALDGTEQTSQSLDLSTSVSRIVMPPAVHRIDDPRAAFHLQLLTAAFATGCADAARDMASDYARVREQFQRPIGWFQAIKHMCADLAVRSAVARSQLYFASCALDEGNPELPFHAAAAKRLADQAALENSRAAIQIHGGIGMTDEAYPHLCLKRAHLLQFIGPVDEALLLGE